MSERVPRSLKAKVMTAASAQRDHGETPSADGRMMTNTPTKPSSESSQPVSPMGSPSRAAPSMTASGNACTTAIACDIGRCMSARLKHQLLRTSRSTRATKITESRLEMEMAVLS